MKCFKWFFSMCLLISLIYGSDKEIVSKRTFTSNTYLSSSGQYRQVIYNYPVNYYENGQYLPIPNNEDGQHYTEIAFTQKFFFTTDRQVNPFLRKK